MQSADRIADVAASVYEAVVSGFGMAELTEKIGELFRSPFVGVEVRVGDWTLRRTFFADSSERERLYWTCYQAKDPFRRAVERAPDLQTVSFADITRNETLAGSAVYRDMLAPMDLDQILALGRMDVSLEIKMAIGRRVGDAGFDKRAARRLETLGRLLDRACRLKASLLQVRDGAQLPAAGQLSKRFQLTSRQAEIAAEITSGRHPSKIAEDFHVSFETIRSHLKNLYAKTGARNRAELVAILAGTGVPGVH